MIVVFGSVNIDLVFALLALPQPGETVLGDSYRIVPGGKGANQAVAAARDGAAVRLYGCIGRDGFGDTSRASLAAAGVDVGGLVSGAMPTGCATICVDSTGRNQIAVASGANLDARAAQVPDSALSPDTLLVVQMETPVAEISALIARAKVLGARVVLNLAPALPVDAAVLSAVDVLVVNEGEAAVLAQAHSINSDKGIGIDEPVGLARRLAGRFGTLVVVTLGGAGAVAASREAAWVVDALAITPVDTTAAGDCFVGVLAAALDRGAAIGAALHRASVAAGLACLVAGAQPSLPLTAAIDARLAALAPSRGLGIV